MSHSNVVFSQLSGKFHLCTRRVDEGEGKGEEQGQSGCIDVDVAVDGGIDTATYNECIWTAVSLFDNGPHTLAHTHRHLS